MPNHCRKILTVAEEMLKKITERYVWHDKSWLEKYEPGEESGNRGREITAKENKRKGEMSKKVISKCPKCGSVCLWHKPDGSVLCTVCMALHNKEEKRYARNNWRKNPEAD